MSKHKASDELTVESLRKLLSFFGGKKKIAFVTSYFGSGESEYRELTFDHFVNCVNTEDEQCLLFKLKVGEKKKFPLPASNDDDYIDDIAESWKDEAWTASAHPEEDYTTLLSKARDEFGKEKRG